MFEFDQYRAIDPGPPIVPSTDIKFASGIKQRSLLIWSEHCIECAAPECFQTCDLYTPRPDNRCRRFELGMRRNNHFRGQTGSAADIIFGKWGKLEARGNTLLVHNGLLSVVETTLPHLQVLVNAFGRLVRRLGGSPPWTSLSFELLDYFSKRLQKVSKQQKNPDGFLIEIYNPAEQDCAVKFSCALAGSEMLRLSQNVNKNGIENGKMVFPYWEKLDLKTGYNRFFIPYGKLSKIVESRLRYNISFTPEEESGVRLVFISADFVALDSTASVLQGAVVPKVDAPIAQQDVSAAIVQRDELKPGVKCVIFDLDNTLWEGVLVEGAVTLKPSIPALFKALDERGILISVASKNNESEALAQLAKHGLKEYLIYPVINWNQKSQNIQWLAEKLSIGTDTFLFVDDSAFEREEVSTSIAGIEVLPETVVDTLLEHPRLQGSGTVESGNRRVMYQQQSIRNEVAVEFGDDYLGFLKSSEIVVTIGMVTDHQKGRVTELLQRTNQLNFSGTMYERGAIDKLLEDNSTDKHVIHCSDKYGDYGLVGFAITRSTPEEIAPRDITVQDFMLSCRVQGKLIEKAFFSYLIDKYTDGKANIAVNFLSTERNGLAQSVLREIGFTLSEGVPARLQVEPGQLDVDFLDLRVEVA